MTMADIGNLLPIEGSPGFRGKLRTLSHKLRLELQPNDDKRGEGSPDFIVYADEGGDMIEIGAAWQRTVQARGGNNGRRFLSITLDDPSFPAPLNVAAFAPDEGGLPWLITWNRPRQQGREAA
jgi:uncharacterized protein (DUF736 family)